MEARRLDAILCAPDIRKVVDPMLPVGFIGSMILDFTKKRTKNEKHLMRNFLLYNMLLFLVFGLVMGGMMACQAAVRPTGRNPAAPGTFLALVSVLFPMIGLVHGLLWWLVFNRKK